MTHSHKKRWSFTTLVDHENNMVMTLNLWDDGSMSLVVDKIVNGKLENKVIEIPRKTNMNDLIKKHQEMVSQ